MGKKDPRVDAYIAAAAPFARPILKSLRKSVHAACRDAEETLKWGHPHFLYRGMLCGMAAFKAHCAFGFWKDTLVVGADRAGGAMGQLGRITALSDLPPDKVIAGWIVKAMKLNEQGVPAPRKAAGKPRPAPAVPADLAAALAKTPAARKTFADFSPSCKREYIEWITEAKREETRAKRLATTLEWLVQGKKRNWKYENC